MRLANLSIVLGAKHTCVLFLLKSDSLSKLGHQEFKTFLVVDLVCYRFGTVREGVSIEKTFY